MNKQRYLADDEIAELAKDVIEEIFKSIKLPQNVSVVEVEDRVGLFFKSPDSSAGAFYSPQNRTVEILREYEDFYAEAFEGDELEKPLTTTLRQHLYLAITDKEIHTLIKKALREFPKLTENLSKVETKILKAAKLQQNKVESNISQVREKIELYKSLYKKTNELQPLWNYIVIYFDENGSTSDISNDDEYKKLADGLDVPKALLRKVYGREIGHDPTLEPLKLAIEHACYLLKIEGKHDSHKNYFYIGKKFVEDDEWIVGQLVPPSA